MNIYTLHSPSHEIFFQDYFLKTLPLDLNLISVKTQQLCESGNYYSKGWKDFCFEKVKFFLKSCQENYGKHFIVADVDIQFFVPQISDILLEEIGDYDIACQNDIQGYCSGFFVCKSNDQTLKLFQKMIDNYILDDQKTLNKYIHICKHKFLSHKFYNIRQNVNGGWRGQQFKLPKEIYLHHANWTIGIENKKKLLDIVKNNYNHRFIDQQSNCIDLVFDISQKYDNHNINTKQTLLNDKFKTYRPKVTYSTYPPYHKGLYLEDYFYQYFTINGDTTDSLYIPVSWTTCYIQNKSNNLQNLLNQLHPKDKYFAVSQHDDAIKEKLPPNTINFCAGGNNGGIPIPLVCSSIPSSDIKVVDKTLLCSFYGSITHPIRQELINDFHNKPNTMVYGHNWSIKVNHTDYLSYIDLGLKSKFLLCPRGYGLNSFRLYESFQLGCVPVIITDKLFLPWIDELDWNSFSVISHDTKNLYEKLINISDTEYKKMLSVGQKLYNDYFTLDGVCKQILKRLQQT